MGCLRVNALPFELNLILHILINGNNFEVVLFLLNLVVSRRNVAQGVQYKMLVSQ